MTSKAPVRSAEDVDETALSYGEIKALATGNPEILRKTELDTEVAKLKIIRQNYLNQKYDLEDKIAKSYPQRIKELEERVKMYEQDNKQLIESTKPNADGFSKMTLKNAEYTDKEQAGKMLLEICGKKTNADKEEIGEYRGFKMLLSFNSVEKEFIVTLKNQGSYDLSLGSDVYGNIKRLDNRLEAIKEKIQPEMEEIEDTKKQLEKAKIEVQKPFAQEEQLNQKLKELDELNIKLNLNEKEKQVLDTSDDTEEPSKDDKDKDRNR